MLSYRRLPGFLSMVLTAALLVPAAAGAQTITVSTTEDPALGQAQCPAEPPLPCSLRQALAQNEVDGGGDTIVLPAGDYNLLTPVFSVRHAVTLTGHGRGDTFISARDQPGIFAFSPIEGQTPVTLSHLTMTGAIHAPAIVSNSVEPLTLDDVAFTVNFGPALDVNHGTVAIRHVSSDGGLGLNTGGIVIHAGDVEVADSEFRNDQSADGTNGGAVRMESGTLTIERSRLTADKDENGAGAHVEVLGGKATIADSTIDHAGDNSSLVDVQAGGELDAFNDTFLENLGPLASGQGTIKLGNSVVSNANAACDLAQGLVVSLGHNVIDDASCNLAGPGDRQGVDPRLGPLQDNGGPTFTALPGVGSPLLAVGAAAACSSSDQRGVARPAGKSCDVGAAQRSRPPAAGAPSVSRVTSTSAALTATADLAFADGTVSFTTSRGSASPAQALLATGLAQPVSATLTGLVPSTAYRVRLAVHTPLGDASSSEVAFTTLPPKPAIRSASLSHARFRVSRRPTAVAASTRTRRPPLPLGTSFRFALSVAARVQIAFTHTTTGLRDGRGRCVAPTAKLRRARAHRCSRALNDGRLIRGHLRGGKVSVPFSGRVGRRALAPRTYVATITAANVAGSAKPVRLRLTVVR